MKQLTTEQRVHVVSCLVEGMSIRATVRLTGVAKNTIVKLLVELGDACERFHDEHVRNVLPFTLSITTSAASIRRWARPRQLLLAWRARFGRSRI